MHSRTRVLIGLLMLVVFTCATHAQLRRPPRGEAFTAVVTTDRTLRLAGTSDGETIVVTVTADGRSLTVDHRNASGTGVPQTSSFALAAFDRIDLRAGGGTDFVNVIDASETLDQSGKVLKLDGGDGDNVIVLSHQPFARETVAKMRMLLMLTERLEDLRRRATAAAEQALIQDAMKVAGRANTGIGAESQAIAADAQTQLIAPAMELLETKTPQVIESTNALLVRLDELAKQHELLVAQLTRELDPGNGVYPPDDNSESRREPTGREPDPAAGPWAGVPARTEPLRQAFTTLGADAEAVAARSATEIESAANAIRVRADAIEQRSMRLAVAADTLAADAERDLTASAERVLAVAAELRGVLARIDEAGSEVRAEILRAVSQETSRQRVAAQAVPVGTQAGTTCKPATAKQTYTGGPNFDFFFPISAPSQSWTIDGGDGFNILIGGFAADNINGGANTDLVFGLGGNDQIRGAAGVDFLFGEFIVELPSQTGDDCIWGDDGLDLIVGDNGFDPVPVGHAGGKDNLVGGDGTDFAFGDDVLDILDDMLPGGSDDIKGGKGVDFLFGCGNIDEISGEDEIDAIFGNGGNDILYGNDGRDVQIGSTTVHIGNLMLGNPGEDEMHGGKGIEVMFGNADKDTMWGGAQLDVMFGNGENDTMRGESGGVLFKIKGVDVRLGNLMFGGPLEDKMWGGGDLDVMFGQDALDYMYGYDGNFQALGVDADVMFGGDEGDIMEGDDESLPLVNSIDFMFGQSGGDKIKGGAQPDLLFGGSGGDTIDGDSNGLTLIASTDLIFGGSENDDIDGGNSHDLIFGGDGEDIIDGDNEAFGIISSHDLIFGGNGNDTINGGTSIDILFGGDGADRLLGDTDQVWQPLSHDVMFGNEGPDDMKGGNSNDLMFGGPGRDRMLGDSSNQGRHTADLMFGGADDDFMDGGANPDLMFGNDGHDTMLGDTGQTWMILSIDLMFGNDGCDTMSGGRAADMIFGGPGVDRIDGDAGPDMLFGGAGGDTINGGDLFDLIFGNEGNDLIHGNSATDVISGGDGNDCLYGDQFVDLIFGNDGDDCLRGGDLPDVLFAGDGNDRAFGDNGSDVIFGGNGDDDLDGGNGADILSGGGGSNELWGGPGPDLLFGGTKHQAGSSGLDCACNIESCVGTVCVRKFNDFDGDGVQSPSEGGLGSWQFTIECGCTSQTVTTDRSGLACATFLSRTCSVTETLQSGWTPTTATTQPAVVNGGQQTDVTFGNRRRQTEGRLCISKFDDRNGNGLQDGREQLLEGWDFSVSPLPAAAASMTTGADGTICKAVPAGNYEVAELPRTGWTSTTPAPAKATVKPGGTTIVSVGNQREEPQTGTICVWKFEDKNKDGNQGAGESGLSNWLFLLKKNGVTIKDVKTSGNGGICGSHPVGTYTVEEVMQPGWTPTTPAAQTVVITANQLINVRFGNVK